MRGKASALAKRLLVPSLADWLFMALVVWLFVTGSGWMTLLADGDTGWHIRTGQYVLDTHTVPRTDLFSFSKPNERWFAWEWLSDVIFAAGLRCASLKGVVLPAGIAIAASLAVLFRHMLRRGGNLLIALAVCLLTAAASGVHYLARPHVFTLLLLAVSLSIADRDREKRDGLVWLLVPLTAVWANLHAGFLSLLLSLAVPAVGAACERRWGEARRFALLTGLCAAASVVNPYGLGLHRHVLEYMRSDWIREAVDEFQSPRFRSESALDFEILLFAGIAAAVCLLRRRRIGEALLIVVWAHAALVSVRHVPVFAIVAGPLIVTEATRVWNRWARGRPARSVPAVLNGLAADLAAGARGVSLIPALFVAVLAFGPGFAWPRDFPTAKFPVELVNRNQAAIRGRRVLTSDQWGDYLIYRFYPVQRVFLDGRSDFYGPEIGRLYLRILYGHPDWRGALDRYRVCAVLAERTWRLANLLRENDLWRIADQRGPAILFERRSQANGCFPAKENPSARRTMTQERRRDDLAQETPAGGLASEQLESKPAQDTRAHVL